MPAAAPSEASSTAATETTFETVAHTILCEDSQGSLMDLRTLQPFNALRHSMFKYGDRGATQSIAEEVVEAIITRRDEALAAGGKDILSLEDGFYIGASASKYVPTAARHLMEHISAELAINGLAPSGQFRIDRSVVRGGDYSAMTSEQRRLYVADNGVYIPGMSAREIAGKTVMLVDDTRITGSNESDFKKCFVQAGVGKAVLCYVATVDPELLARRPKIEHEVNHATVKNLEDLAEIVREPSFHVNARICRFILEHSAEEVEAFIRNISLDSGRILLNALISDGYHNNDDTNGVTATIARTLKK